MAKISNKDTMKKRRAKHNSGLTCESCCSRDISTGVFDASSKILIRGNTSLTKNNQPLIIVDGVSWNNQTNQTAKGVSWNTLLKQDLLLVWRKLFWVNNDALFTSIEVWNDWRKKEFLFLTANEDIRTIGDGQIPQKFPTPLSERSFNNNVIVESDVFKPVWFAKEE